MKGLSNLVDKRILKQQLHSSPVDRLTLSFYKYVRIDNPVDFRDRLFIEWKPLGILGRVYVAHEGINAHGW